MILGRAAAAAIALCAVAAVPALANMGNPYTAGSPAGEPTGLEQVAIERETLEIDLRPLASGKSAEIVATYAVRNDGAERSLPLVFVAAALDGAAARPPAISLDGAAVPITEVRRVAKPAEWRAPATTPGLGERETLTYIVQDPSGLRFDLALPPGRHTVRAAYAATATKAAMADSPLVYWQLGYVLAPARQWASFGGLDVRVSLPPGWSAASSPVLARSGDTLSGTFRDVPADALALTTQAPIPATTNAGPLIAAGILPVTLAVAWLVGAWLGGRRRSAWWALPVTLAGAGLWVVATALAFAEPGVDMPGQTSYTYGYGSTFTIAILAPFAYFIGWVAMQLLARIASGRARGRLAAA